MGPLSEVRFQNVRADKCQTARLSEPRCTLDRTPLVQLVRAGYGSGNGSISEMNTVELVPV
jgi:hypothetical protein